MKKSLIYKNKAGTKAPEAFGLISPADGAETKTTVIFKWESALDYDGEKPTYNLIIGTDSTISSITIKRESLTGTMVEVTGLNDLTSYYWKVEAVDRYGNKAVSGARQFRTNNTNYTGGVITGVVVTTTGEAISGASIKSNLGNYFGATRDEAVKTGEGGEFVLITIDKGEGTVSCSKEGYEPNPQVIEVTVSSGVGNEAVMIVCTLNRMGFGDLEATTEEFRVYIAAIHNAGITVGCGGGNYCPGRATKRGERTIFYTLQPAALMLCCFCLPLKALYIPLSLVKLYAHNVNRQF